MLRRIASKGKYLINDILRLTKIKENINTDLKYKLYETELKHTFFGYYDKSPFSFDNKKILAISTNHDGIVTKPVDAVVGYFDSESRVFTQIDTTTTWCWQQGCRLMWFTDTSVIYNKIVDGEYGSIVYDIEQNKVLKQYDFSIYDKTPDNKYALSLNFSRLQYFRPGYGYSNLLKEEDKVKVKKNDGIWLCDLEKNTKKLIISLKDIIKKEPKDTFENAFHYINHLKFLPNSESFIFYHIWNTEDNKRYTRTIWVDLRGQIMKVLDNSSFMSHDTFKDNQYSLIFTKLEQLGYYLHDLKSNEIELFNKDVKDDGHPTFLDGNTVLTDTYPDRLFKEQRLFIFTKNKIKTVAKIYSPSIYQKEFRCDLHPRVSNNKENISIDIPTFSGRKIMCLELNKYYIKGVE